MTKPSDKTSLNQRIAADPQKSAWVSANAGSGKTHVLVNRIIRLMLEGAQPGKILALTFTKAAAAEMANRLNTRLAAWALLSRDELIDDITDITGTPPPPAQLLRARRLFAQALETPGGLKIQTIHAFCERILHRFALEAGVAPNFEILDERTSAELLEHSREQVFANLESEIIDDLKVVSGALSAADFDDLMKQVLKRRTLLRTFRRTFDGMDEMLANLRQTFGLKPEETGDNLLAEAIAAPAAIDGLIELFSAGTDAEVKKAEMLMGLRNNNNPEHKFELYKSLFLTKAGKPREKLATKDLGEANPDQVQFLADEQERIVALDEKLVSARIAEYTGCLLRIANKILGTYETAKRVRALLDYADLIQNTADLLLQTQAAAWVLYKLDNGIDHILVAQDTSPEQWQVVASLSEEFFAGIGADTPLRTIFAVGDEKQSIFAFQGANPEEFDRMRRHFQRRAAHVDHDFEKVTLTVSFRSTREILAAVDMVFAQTLAAQGMTSLGSTPVHEPFRRGQAGLVEIWPLEQPDEDAPKDPWDAPLDYTSVSSPRVRLAHKIAATIKGWIGSETLTPRGRPVRAGDILILVRRRNNFVDALVEALKTSGVAVAGIDRMKLSQQLAVMDLLALARFVLLRDDDLNLAIILKGPLFGLDDDDLFDLAYQREATLWQALDTTRIKRFAEARDTLAAMLKTADMTRPYEFFETILNAAGGRRKFIRRLGLEVEDAIDEFLALCLEYEKTNTPSLQGFVAWFAAGSIEVKRDMEHGRDEVRIMTVHGAKGLEANIVMLPDTCHRVPDTNKQAKLLTTAFIDAKEEKQLLMWHPNKSFENEVMKQSLEREQKAEIEEYNRLLYVAMTRARDRLYIAGYEGKQSASERSWYYLVFAALKDQAEEISDQQGNILCWRIAGRQSGDAVEKSGSDGPAIQAQTPPHWAQQPVRPEARHIDLINPSQLGSSENGSGMQSAATISDMRPSPLQSPPQERYLRGRLIHKLLEYAPDAHPATYGDFCYRFLQRTAPSLSSRECRRIVDEVQRVLDAGEFSVLFEAHGLSEVPIVGEVHLAKNQRLHRVSGRIDRLIVRENQVLAIDFKTDRIIADSPQTVAIAYLRQMAVYKHLLHGVFPGKTIICQLLWTMQPLLMELPEALLASVLEFSD